MSFCQKCGHEISEGDAFCPNCGAPVARTEDFIQPIKRQDVSIRPTRNGGGTAKIVAILGTVLMIISGFLPWAESQLDMLKGFGDPVLYVMIFLAIVSLVAIQIKNLYVIPIIFGIVATAFGIWVRDPEKLISFMSGFGPQALPKIKYGLYVYIFGSFILLISGIVGLIRR